MAHTPNRLIRESSPYLLQHAHNPVDWYPWGKEALDRARQEDKPILVSIGYAACHWCHVMERESFEDEETAALMNRHFINIKIDREERPDLDHIYMDALQAMSGKGGWPLNVFLTPDTRPFFGGTYFPPRPAYHLNSWKEVLSNIAVAFRDRREELEAQASQLTAHLEASNRFGVQEALQPPAGDLFPKDSSYLIFTQLLKVADTAEGGFGAPPKFPQTNSIRFLLHHYFFTQEEQSLKQACLSLDKMIFGGIYDQVGGGFSRYATDRYWLVPHFEKMLYDNALLVDVLSEAWQLTGRAPYKRAIEETLRFAAQEWLSPDGMFYSAFDADSEGEEGRYYVWQEAEIREALGDSSALFCAYFDVKPEGNWEGHTILNVPVAPEAFARERGLSEAALQQQLTAALDTLRAIRQQRTKPLLDDKQLLGWNALMVRALAKAYAALGHDHYRELAVRTGEALWEKFFRDGQLFHGYTKGQPGHPAFLDDYAYLIQALIQLQEITASPAYLEKARMLTQSLLRDFSDEEQVYFYFTSAHQQDIIVRKKEIYDGATPSGNAIMAFNLYYLGVVFDESSWRERAYRMVKGLQPVIEKYPGSFGAWAVLLQGMAEGIPEISLVGDNFNLILSNFLRTFIPLKIFQAGLPDESYALLSGKLNSTHAQFYLCKQFRCQQPVSEIDSLMRLLKKA